MSEALGRRVKTLLADHPELARWNDLVEDFLHQFSQQPPLTGSNCADDIIDNLSLILTCLPGVASTHDELQDTTGNINTLDVLFTSTRFNVTFGMGFDFRCRSIYLCDEMLRPAQLWRVPAEFWETMASLSRISDDVVYEPSDAAPDPADPSAARHLERSKCAVFGMIANYTMLKAQCALPEPECGFVTVHWAWSTQLEPLLTHAAMCFASLSRMNWLLHRVNYADRHARARKAQNRP